MATKNITISEEVFNRLCCSSVGKMTYNDILSMLLDTNDRLKETDQTICFGDE